MEFHISNAIRDELELDDLLFSFTGNVIFANVAASRKLAQRLDELKGSGESPATINAGALFAMGLIDELSHALVARYRKERDPEVMSAALRWLGETLTAAQVDRLLLTFTEQFSSLSVYRGETTAQQWLEGRTEGRSNREIALEEMLLLWLANANPAFEPFRILFADQDLKLQTPYGQATVALPDFFSSRPPVEPGLGSLLEVLRAPALASPDSLTGQLDYIREKWTPYLGEDLRRVLLAIDVLREEEVAIWMRFHPAGPDHHRHGAPGRGGEGFVGDEFIGFESDFVTGPDGVRRRRYATDYQAPLHEYEAFSADQAWMPTVVLIAKNTYVWLEQLSKQYGRYIQRLDQIPDEELRTLADRGITGLWLIGLWERSQASRTIKRLRGNSHAVASAYSLKDYMIAEDLGGEAAYEDLRNRAAAAGLRLASDMVPNHMGIDSNWVIEHPEWFLARGESPFPSYSFEGPDLSNDSRIEIKIEDHYYDQTDAAVVFRLRHHREGTTRFMYHGNDGTTFAWNDTAQLDYSKAEVREHVIQVILNVARRFPIIRFDAAMVLAKRHVQRLWFPLPGAGGSIPSRAEDSMSQEAFDALMPHEFWREVVDRVAVEVPGTLLLAEAFWLLEGYFVRTLGMHRVYNSAFMNMLRDEENAKYRSYLKKTVEFDPDILKRYVNFMSNPDERTAIDQFGSGDKYFGVSVLLATLPGLPMFGHGQIEGFTERYGMDFKQARLEEWPNEDLVARHQYLIAPLLKNRQIFAESTNFVLYDFWTGYGTVDENVFAYSNFHEGQRSIILYNNSYGSTRGTIHMSVGYLDKRNGQLQQRSLAQGLNLNHDGSYDHQNSQSHDDSLILAYRDRVVGLEYLRRPGVFRDHGLTLDLHGYQHVVLLDWRELRSTETHPWDRLCDALNGSGVRSVDEALSQLRLQPLVDALHQSLNTANLQAFVQVSGEQARARQAAQIKSSLAKASTRSSQQPALEPLGTPEDVARVDPRLADFVAKVPAFAATALSLSAAKHSAESPTVGASGGSGQDVSQPPSKAPASTGSGAAETKSAGYRAPLYVERTTAALSLPLLVSSFPAALKAAAGSVLPDSEAKTAPAVTWGAVMAWIVLSALPSPASALALYDELRLRHALADAFSAIGLHGEPAWKAAARLRVLLTLPLRSALVDTVASEAFWQDPDVRWLTGLHTGGEGQEYFNQESFEAVLCWLQMPALIGVLEQPDWNVQDAGTIAAAIATLSRQARTASYNLRLFRDLLSVDHLQDAKTGQGMKAAKNGKEDAGANAESTEELTAS